MTTSVPASPPHPDHRVSLKTLSGYGSIQLGINMASTMVLVHLLYFYTDVVHLTPARAGLVILLGHIWDGITDPLMGLISDRIRTRWGRRRPFFIPGSILMAGFYALLFLPPANLEGDALFWYMLGAYVMFCTGRTVLDVPYNALTPDLTTHYDERSRLAGWRTGFMIFGDILGGQLPIALLIALGTQRPAFATACAILGTLCVLCGFYGTWGTRERPAPEIPAAPPPPAEAPSFSAQVRTVAAQVRSTVMSVVSLPSGVLMLTFGLVVMGTAFPYTTFRYMSKYFFHDPDLDWYIMMLYQGGGLVAAPCWIWASRRLNKAHTYQAAIFGYIFSTLPVLFCGPDDKTLFLAAMAACGFFGTGIWMLPNAIAPDVIEWHRLTKPEVKEGAFYGLWSFTSKFAGGVTPWIIGVTLSRVGWVPDVVQDGRVLQTIIAMFVIYPLIFMGLGVVIFTWYPITREVYEDIMRQLAERHAQAPENNA